MELALVEVPARVLARVGDEPNCDAEIALRATNERQGRDLVLLLVRNQWCGRCRVGHGGRRCSTGGDLAHTGG